MAVKNLGNSVHTSVFGVSHLDAFFLLSLLNWRTVHSFVPFELFHQLRTESFCILVSLSHFQVFFSGYALYFHWTIFIISLIRLLGISNEGLHWRYWLLFLHLWQKHWKFHHATSFIFCGNFSLCLPFSWQISSKIQHKSKCK